MRRRFTALVPANLENGHLLPRSIEDIRDHVARFFVAEQGGQVVGCAELARLSPTVAEVRSLVVDESLRGQKIGHAAGRAPGFEGDQRRLLDALRVHARAGALRAARLHDRAAHLDAGEDRARLQRLRAVPPLRPVCGPADAPPGRRSRSRADRRHGPRPRRRAAAPQHRAPDPDAGSGRKGREKEDREAVLRSRHDRPRDADDRRGRHGAGGFRASGVACGIKANGKPDLSLLVSETLASAAAVFTTNVAQAAPILVSREHLQQAGGRATAVVVNSGCANAVHGRGRPQPRA